MIVYIYALLDPDTDEVRYIGKTINLKQRFTDHYNTSAKGNNPYKARWIGKLKAQGKRPKMIVLEECAVDTWEDIERHWITHHRSIGSRLTNVLSGGLGGRDFQPRARSPRPIRENLPGKIYGVNVTKAMYQQILEYVGPRETVKERNRAISVMVREALEQFIKRYKRANKSKLKKESNE